jgi:flagellar hook-basal body complex protein FliE
MDTALSAINAYKAAAKKVGTGAVSAAGGGDGVASASAMPQFKGLMKNEVEGVGQQLKSAEKLASAGITGQAPLIDVVTALSSAELSLETMIAVRDQVIAAYQEIMRMPV